MPIRTPTIPVPANCSTLLRSARDLIDLLLAEIPLAAVLLFISGSLVIGQDRPDRSIPQGERVHYGDLLDVDVVGSLEFDWRGVLTPEGFIDGPERLNGPLYALCKTESEIAAAVRDRYRSILRDPNVVVRIIDRSNRALAYVNGAIRSPQRLQLRRPLRLSELLVLSGGITDASNGEISIFRPPNVNCRGADETSFENAATQSPRRFSVLISDLLSGRAGSDLQILPGDVVTVVEAGPVFVSGDVRTPRRLNITPEMTVSRAIAASGGAVKPFNGQRARIYRRGSAEVIQIDLGRVAGGKQADPKLEPYDVVEVEQKGVEPKRRAALDALSDPKPEIISKLPLRIVD